LVPFAQARPLYLVTKEKPSGAVRDFLQWILSDGQKYLDEVGYIPLPAEQLAKEREKLQ
jgi:phosphate transport system substrate-binding protein